MRRLNRLGAFRFRNWIGTPPGRIKERVEVLTSPGIDFDAVRLLGSTSEQFTIDSVIDQFSPGHARQLYAAYCTVIGGTASKLVWNDYDYDTEKQRAVVLNCELLSIERKAAICGAITPGFTCDLRVRWRLLLVPWNLSGDED